jgi:hypothetical protein
MYRKEAVPSRFIVACAQIWDILIATLAIWRLLVVSKKATPEAKHEVMNSAVRSGFDYALHYDVEAEVEVSRRDGRRE